MDQSRSKDSQSQSKPQLTPMPKGFKSVLEFKAFMDEHRGFAGRLKKG